MKVFEHADAVFAPYRPATLHEGLLIEELSSSLRLCFGYDTEEMSDYEIFSAFCDKASLMAGYDLYQRLCIRLRVLYAYRGCIKGDVTAEIWEHCAMYEHRVTTSYCIEWETLVQTAMLAQTLCEGLAFLIEKWNSLGSPDVYISSLRYALHKPIAYRAEVDFVNKRDTNALSSYLLFSFLKQTQAALVLDFGKENVASLMAYQERIQREVPICVLLTSEACAEELTYVRIKKQTLGMLIDPCQESRDVMARCEELAKLFPIGLITFWKNV